MGFNRSSLNGKMSNSFQQISNVAEGKSTWVDTSRPAYKLPAGMKYNKWKMGNNYRNILMAEAHHDASDYAWYYSVNIHEIPNPADPDKKHRFPCLRMIGKRCPICDMKDQLDTGNNWKEIKDYAPKQKILMYMQNVNSGVGEKEVTFFEGPASAPQSSAFYQKLCGAAVAMANGNGVIPFAEPDAGKLVVIGCVKETFNSHEYASPNAVFFSDRTEQVPDELYEKCPAFTDIINFATEAEMESALQGNYTYTGQSAPTEAQKQESFEQQVMKEAPATQNFGFQQPQAPAPQQFLNEADFNKDPYTMKPSGFGSPSAPAAPQGFGAPAAPQGFGSPSGFTNRFGG